ncbi:sensor histidine kinase [Streptomyces capitiformicae]|uniref:histidine kinase n=1 Tax=Streptomyces capitiformicae TaxID=2014920 RepID=A0A919GJM3_9ACTN|nr:histidine kinase [Streptomyces capitiformicae]GHH85804.1 hypothetical protein GCM10017771_20340 [Streptomyces capitiformicae]
MCGALNGTAVLALTLPYFALDPDDGGTFGAAFVLLLLVGSSAGLSAYLRTLDHRRTAAVTEIRRAERVAMAADLHDFVAHHVTGILVQTQVARMMADTEPERLDPVLAGIERAATEALVSTRRTAGAQREHEDDQVDAAHRRPVGDLAGISEPVRGFDGVGGVDAHTARLDRGPSVPDDLPHEVQAAAFRVVQESPTNVRRHAADATEVTVLAPLRPRRPRGLGARRRTGRCPAPGGGPGRWLRARRPHRTRHPARRPYPGPLA